MASIETVATITTKGQITLPKSIRQALGVDSGDKIKFHLMDDQVVVTRINENSHEDPAIKSFLSLLEKDIQSGGYITCLPEALAAKMLAATGQSESTEISSGKQDGAGVSTLAPCQNRAQVPPVFFGLTPSQKIIIYAWVNDAPTLRASGSKTDPYTVFQKMLSSGRASA